MPGLTDDARDLFDGPNVAHLATVSEDGSPHSVPLWAGVEGNRIAFFTESSSRKVRNIDGDARVALSIVARDDPYRMASVRGRVVERLDGPAGLEIIDRIAQKYTGRPYEQREGLTAFLVEPGHVVAHDFG